MYIHSVKQSASNSVPAQGSLSSRSSNFAPEIDRILLLLFFLSRYLFQRVHVVSVVNGNFDPFIKLYFLQVHAYRYTSSFTTLKNF